ncbi:MAG: hypothetical protein K6U89_13240 [Chloroflexi bacterium]|nr:hypothetical protein [Chloroflexota bacterium]
MRAAVLFLALLGALLLASAALAAGSDPLVSPRQLTQGRGNHLRPAWSPDGRQIAYQANDGGGNYAIWVINRDGSGNRRLTDGAGDDRRPAWSPDGSLIAFDSARGADRDIWIVPSGGGAPRRLTDLPGDETFVSFSPDGRQIAFYTYLDGVMEIATLPVTGGRPRILTQGLASVAERNCTFACHSVSWSPDGTRLAYTGGDQRNVFVMNSDGSNPQRVTNRDRIGAYHFPDWLADGSLVFISDERGEKPWTDIWRLDPNGMLQQLYTRVDHGGPFAWSPDGKAVAFHSPRTGQFQIYLAELEGNGIGGPLATFRAGFASSDPMRTVQAPAVWAAAGVVLLLLAVGLGLSIFWLRQRSTRRSP